MSPFKKYTRFEPFLDDGSVRWLKIKDTAECKKKATFFKGGKELL